MGKRPTSSRQSNSSRAIGTGIRSIGGSRATPAGTSEVRLVNMIPKSLSAETNQDSEPNIAVNPQNPNQIVATAFTPDPADGDFAPIYVSNDGGQTWILNSTVPSQRMTGDISVAFSPTTNTFYAGILSFPAPDDETILKILRTATVTSSKPMTTLSTRTGVDQPFVLAGVSSNGKDDRVYIGDNDLATTTKTSTIDACLTATQAKAKFKSLRIDGVGGSGQNGPQVRPACHSDGTVYVTFYRWVARSGSWTANTLVVTADVVVVRDDDGASKASPFSALKDSDGSVGKRVASRVQFPFHITGQGVPGQQRRGGDLAIAVDPNNSSTLYLAWCALDSKTGYTLHLRKSTDRGVTWSPNDLRTISEALNPALAINSDGQLAFLYQQLMGTGASERWVTHLRRSLDNTGANWDDLVLANVPATSPTVARPIGFDPYIGDYVGMVSVGKNFFGAFCANNTPDLANFPNGVVFQRNHDFATRRLLDLSGKTVAPSIDPFFFKVAGS
jgi:hypothetical protein